MTRLSPRTIARRQLEIESSKARTVETARRLWAAAPAKPDQSAPQSEQLQWAVAFEKHRAGLSYSEAKLLLRTLMTVVDLESQASQVDAE